LAIINKILTVWILLVLVVLSVFMFCISAPLWVVSHLFDRRKRLLHLFACAWGSIPVWLFPGWKTIVIDRKKFDNSKTYVIVANHQSQLDILLSFNLFKHFKWISKTEVFKVPFIGWNMYLNDYIGIDRGNKNSTEKMMQQCEDRLNEGSSVFFFPEGTRSRTTEVMKFKAGAFHLAHKMKKPILLIAIHGTGKALPKHSLKYTGRQNLYLKVIGEMAYEDYASLSVEETAEKARSIIIDEVNKLKSLEG